MKGSSTGSSLKMTAPVFIINHVFDRPVEKLTRYFASDNEERWPESPPDIVAHIAETFERSGKLLALFSDEQLKQGFWYLFYNSPTQFMDASRPGTDFRAARDPRHSS